MFYLQNLQHSGKIQDFHKNTEELDETSSEDDSDDSERQGKECFVFKSGENEIVKLRVFWHTKLKNKLMAFKYMAKFNIK